MHRNTPIEVRFRYQVAKPPPCPPFKRGDFKASTFRKGDRGRFDFEYDKAGVPPLVVL
jgi:hypothetical protein